MMKKSVGQVCEGEDREENMREKHYIIELKFKLRISLCYYWMQTRVILISYTVGKTLSYKKA